VASQQSSGGVIFFEQVDYGGAAGQALAKGNYTRAQLQATGVQDKRPLLVLLHPVDAGDPGPISWQRWNRGLLPC